LRLYLTGNLNGLIGTGFKNTNYVRHKDLEFSVKNISEVELIQKIAEIIAIIKKSLNMVKKGELKDEFPVKIYPEPIIKEHYLIHIATHINYNLKQTNDHRRLLDK
jgi:hypothetical protein